MSVTNPGTESAPGRPREVRRPAAEEVSGLCWHCQANPEDPAFAHDVVLHRGAAQRTVHIATCSACARVLERVHVFTVLATVVIVALLAASVVCLAAGPALFALAPLLAVIPALVVASRVKKAMKARAAMSNTYGPHPELLSLVREGWTAGRAWSTKAKEMAQAYAVVTSIGLGFVVWGAWIGRHQAPTCEGERMSPGDVCEIYREPGHVVVNTRTYHETLESTAATNSVVFRIGLVILVLVLVAALVHVALLAGRNRSRRSSR